MPAATFTWNGGGSDANWSTAANWTGNAVPANDGTAAILLAGTTRLSPNVDVGWDIGSLAFSNNAGAFVLAGSTLNIRAGGVINSSTNGQVILGAITLATNQTWSATAGTITFNGNINNVTNLLTIAGNFNSLIGGVISGTGGLTKAGTGTNFLGGANTYSGLTTISAGVINIQNGSALGSTNAGTIITSGATLQLQGGINVTNETLTLNGTGVSALGALRSLTNDNSWNGTITLASISTISCDANSLTLGAGGIVNSTFLLTITDVGNVSVTGSIGNGTGALTKAGVGTLTLTASNSYSGLTTVSAGVLNVQNNSALGTTAAGTTVASGAALQLQGGFDVTGETLSLSGTGISGGGALRNLNGSNSWSGAITLSAASTVNADAGTLYIGANVINSTFLATFTNNGTILLSGALGSGTGGLTKTGTGTLVVNGANTYTGATTVSGGVLQFGATGNLPSASAITVNAGSTLDLNGLNKSVLSLAGAGGVTLGSGMLTVNNIAASTFSGVMSGTGGLIKAGTGTFTVSGANTYSGGTTINAGAITIGSDGNLGNIGGALTLNGGTLTTSATLTSVRPITLTGTGGTVNPGGTTLTLAGNITGAGALTKIGTKTLALTGTNTYLGGTTNGAGTITINSDARLGDPSGPITFSASATLTTTASFSSARNIFLNAGTATFSAGTGFTNTLFGVISGAGAFTQSGAGVLVFNGINTYTNTTTISAGTLRLGGNERISDLSAVIVTKTTATFDLNGFNETVGSLASTAAGKVTLGSGSLTAGGNNTSTTLSAVISGTGSFTKAGTGTLIFSGANTYTGTTTIGGGTLQISASERIANTSPVVVGSGAVLNLNNFNETIGSLAGSGSVTLGSGILTAGNASAANFSGSISGTGAFVKVGAGTQTLSGANTYNGTTTISVGNLQVNGSAGNSAATIASGATLSGAGAVGSVAINLGSTAAPGAAGPGTLASGPQTWASAGNYNWQINNATGAKGGDPGWSWMNIAGTLTINASSGSKFVIKVVSLTSSDVAGQAASFDNTATYVWKIASASGGISGFDPAKFTIDASAFQNSLGAGTFGVSQNGNDLNLIFTTAAQAAIKGVQSGTLSSSGNGTNTATLTTAVNPANAFLIFNTRHNSSAPGGSMVRGRIASSNSVEFARATAETSTINIQWYVVEYSAGVKVQRGEVNQTNVVINVPLTPLAATNQAFVLWSKTPDSTETAFTDSDPVIGEITTTSNLQFRAGAAPSSVPIISWQVIEFSHPASINVQRGSVTNMTGTNTLATATLGLPVDTNRTFLLTGYRTSGSGAGVGARMLRAQLTDSSTITFDRGISGAPDDIPEILWQAVQLKDGSAVQRGTVNFANAVAQTNATILSLNTNRAAAFASVQPAGGQNLGRSSSTGSALGVGAATMALTSLTQVTFDRNNTSDTADFGWSVVGFGPGSLLAPATGGSPISADTTGGAYTSLTGPTYTEIESANVGAGTIILNAPAGFVFDVGGTAPTVLITRVGGSGANALNINGVASGTSVGMTSATANSMTFTVTSASSGGVTCSLAWQNLHVRPSAGTPLASGNLTSSGTAVVQGVTINATSWGLLAETVGAATKLGFQTAPSSAAVAGVEFAQQPAVQVQDQFGNARSGDNSTVVTAAINTGTGALQGPTTATTVGGVATFSGLSYQVAETLTLSFATPGVAGKNSGNIVVSPAPASQLTIQTQPSSSATAGVSFTQQPVVRVEDQFGNLRSADNGTVVIASLNQGSGALLGALTATAANGVATFNNLSYQVAETITMDFTSGALDPETSANVAVNPAAASQLVIQTQPSSVATAGAPFAVQPAIQIQDQFGNLRAADNSTVITASRNAGSGSGALQGTLTATAVNGVAAFTNLSHPVAGDITLDFAASGLTGTSSGTITVSPGALDHFAFAALATQTAGASFNATITGQDANNNTVTSFTGTANLSTTAGTISPTVSGAFSAGTRTESVTVSQTGSGKTITATRAGGSETGTSAGFTVNPGAIDHYVVSAGTAQTAGTAFTVTVTANDINNNTVTTDSSTVVTLTGTGSVQFDSNGDATFGDNTKTLSSGAFTISTKDTVAQSITVTATDGNSNTGNSSSITVNPGAIDHYVVSAATPQTAGTAFTVTVTAKDVNNNTVTADSTTVVTLTGTGSVQFDSNGDGTFGDNIKTLSSGAFTISTRDMVAQPITITATSAGPKTGTSSSITVNPGTIDHYVVSTATPQAAGTAFIVTVTAKDVNNNTVTTDSTTAVTLSDTGSVEFDSNGDGTFGDNIKTLSSGAFSISAKDAVAQSITVTATDGNSKTGTSSSITVNPGSIDHYVVSAATQQTAGTAFTVTVTAKDVNNNTVTTDSSTVVTLTGTGSVQFDSNGDAIFGDNTKTLSSGVFTISTRDTVAQSITVTATDGNSKTGTSSSITVNPGAIDHYVANAATLQTAGTPFTVMVTAKDVNNNTVTTDSTTVVTLTGTGSVQFDSNGDATFGDNTKTLSSGAFTISTRDTVAQSITITATDGNSKTGTSSSITVNPGAIDHYVANAATPQTAGTPFTVTVTAKDANNNTLTADNSTVVTLTGTGSVQFDGNGDATFGDNTKTLSSGAFTISTRDTVAQSITVTATDGNSKTGSSSSITVNPGAIDHYAASAGTPQTVATNFSTTVTAKDSFNNTVTTDSATVVTLTGTGSVQFDSNGNGTFGDNTKTLSSGALTISTKDTVAESISITATDGNSKTGTSTSITIQTASGPAAIDHYVVSASSPQTAGTNFNTTVTAKDSFNNTVTTDSATVVTLTGTGSVQFDSNGDGTFDDNTRALSNGVFTTTTKDDVAEGITLTATDGNNATGASSNIVINPGPIDHYSVDAASLQTAGAAFITTVVARDSLNNAVTTDSSTVVTVTGTGNVQFDSNGDATFGDHTKTLSGGAFTISTKDTVAESITITAADGNSKTATSPAITISPDVIDHYVVSTVTPQTAETPFTVTVTAKDDNNNTVTYSSRLVTLSGTGSVQFDSNGDGTFDDNTKNLSSGVLTISTKDAVAESITITATDGSSKTGTSSSLTVNPGPIHHYSVDAASPQTAGAAFIATVVARDSLNNAVTTDNSTLVTLTGTGSVQFDSNGDATFGDHTKTLTNGAFTISAKDNVAESITITASDGNSKTGTSPGIVISPGVIDHYVVSTSTPQTAGAPFTVTVTAKDDHDNTVTYSSRPVTLTGTGDVEFDANSVGTFDNNATNLSSGVLTISTKDDVAESITITATDGSSKTGTSSSITVNPGPIHYYSVDAASPQTAEAAFITTVVARDSLNNAVTTDSSTLVTLTGTWSVQFDSNGDGTFGDHTKTLTNGAFTISTKDTVAESITITAADGNSKTGTSPAITISPGVIDHYVVSAATPQTAGAPFTVTVTAKDVNNNTVTYSSRLVTLSGTGSVQFDGDRDGTFGDNTRNLSSGVLTISTKDAVAESITITATDGSSKTGTSSSITVDPGALDHFVLGAIAAQTVGASFDVTITAKDTNNNTVAGFSGTVDLTTTAGTISPSVSSGFSGGVRMQSVAITQAGSGKTITATKTSGSESGTSAGFTVNEGNSANGVSSSANPSPTSSNVTFTATLTAVAPSSGTPSGSVQFRADGAALGSPVTLVSGVASLFSASLSHGTHTITAEYAGDGNFFGSTNTLSPNEVINTAPVAANVTLQRYLNSGVKIRTAALLANDTDPDNDALTLISFSETSASSGTNFLHDNWISYEAPGGFTNSDSFSYVFADSGGLQATGSVSVIIRVDLDAPQNIAALTDLGHNASRIQFLGIPARVYTIQYTTNLVAPDWQPLGSGTADATGSFEWIDTPANGSLPRFYRSTYP